MVKRYDPKEYEGIEIKQAMEEHPFGDYVLTEDYEDLKDQFETLQNRHKRITDLVHEIYQEV